MTIEFTADGYHQWQREVDRAYLIAWKVSQQSKGLTIDPESPLGKALVKSGHPLEHLTIEEIEETLGIKLKGDGEG